MTRYKLRGHDQILHEGHILQFSQFMYSIMQFRLQRANLLNSIYNVEGKIGYIVMLRARMFRSSIPVPTIKERNIRARNITI